MCRNFVRFGPVTPELEMLTFVAIWQKSAYHVRYFRVSSIDLYLIYRFGMQILLTSVKTLLKVQFCRDSVAI